MKAEHRKELQTNTLAASMTRFVQRIKTKPKRRTVLWIVLGVLVVTVLGTWWWISRNRAQVNSQLWFKVDLPYIPEGQSGKGKTIYAVQTLLANYPGTPQARAAYFQLLHRALWEDGVKRLLIKEPAFGNVPFLNPSALQIIKEAKQDYEKIVDQVKDDPILGAEARYNIAVAQECLAIEDLKLLDEAIPLYERVQQDYPDSARAKAAQKRVQDLKNATTRHEINNFYLFLSIRAGGLLQPRLFGNQGKDQGSGGLP